MTYRILKGNGQIICRSTVKPLLKEEWSSEAKKEARVKFDNTITEKYGEYDPVLLGVFDNEDIVLLSTSDDAKGTRRKGPETT
jgi:hypothetical protein